MFLSKNTFFCFLKCLYFKHKMITILVVEDEREVYAVLAQALLREGYSFVNEPESGGLIKIIKKSSHVAFSGKALDLKSILLRERNGLVYKSALAEIEKPLIESVLEQTNGNQVKAAKILGINRNTLRKKVNKLRIDVSKWKVE